MNGPVCITCGRGRSKDREVNTCSRCDRYFCWFDYWKHGCMAA